MANVIGRKKFDAILSVVKCTVMREMSNLKEGLHSSVKQCEKLDAVKNNTTSKCRNAAECSVECLETVVRHRNSKQEQFYKAKTRGLLTSDLA